MFYHTLKTYMNVFFDSNISWPRKLTFDLEAEILLTGLYMESSQCVLAHAQPS